MRLYHIITPLCTPLKADQFTRGKFSLLLRKIIRNFYLKLFFILTCSGYRFFRCFSLFCNPYLAYTPLLAAHSDLPPQPGVSLYLHLASLIIESFLFCGVKREKMEIKFVSAYCLIVFRELTENRFQNRNAVSSPSKLNKFS